MADDMNALAVLLLWPQSSVYAEGCTRRAGAGLFVDALQHWLSVEQGLLVVVDPADEERRPSQVPHPMPLVEDCTY